jgi:hypothetical protein
MSAENKDYSDPFTGELVNDEPVFYKGLTRSEWGVLATRGVGYAVAFLFVVSVVLWPFIDIGALFLSGLLCYLTLKRILKKVPDIRDGKPPGYLDHYIGKKGFIGFLKLAYAKKKPPIRTDMVDFSLGREGVEDE